MIERADRLNTPPVAGLYYMVPVVTAKWHDAVSAWPVIGPAHTDVEFFNFTAEHYHIDGRFLTARQRSMVKVWWRTLAEEIQSAPLHAYRGEPPLPKPVLAKRRCSISDLPYEHGGMKEIQALRQHFAGIQCERGKGGWICPHRKASLGSVVAVDGIITCPLHGLQIDATTGVTLSPAERGGDA